MKTAWKRIFSLTLALAVMATMTLTAFAAEDKETELKEHVTKSTETYMYTQLTTPYLGTGPISITQGTLTKDGKTTDIYLVALHGLETNAFGSAVNIANCVLSGAAAIVNSYLWDLNMILQENVPAGANLVIAGHSLGGMVAQQAGIFTEITERYNILNIVAYGSPLIAENTEGELNRLTDTTDLVPYLSYNTVLDFEKQKGTRHEGTSESFSFDNHVNSYKTNSVWKGYDAVGVPGGNAYMDLDLSTYTGYQAPVFEITLGLNFYFAYEDDGNWKGFSINL